MNHRIAFIGPQGAGKTTLAKAWLATQEGTAHLSFAAELRYEVAAGLRSKLTANIIDEMLDPNRKAVWRPVLQAWGMMRRERFGEDYWADKVESAIGAIESTGAPHSIAIDDCRFRNEWEMLDRNHFKFVRLAAHDATPQLDHASEHDWPHFPFDLAIETPVLSERLERLKSWLGGFE